MDEQLLDRPGILNLDSDLRETADVLLEFPATEWAGEFEPDYIILESDCVLDPALELEPAVPWGVIEERITIEKAEVISAVEPYVSKLRIATVLTAATVLAFEIFWMVMAYLNLFHIDAPFALFPYDFISSVGFQIPFAICLWTLARTFFGAKDSPEKSIYIARGNIVALAVILLTLEIHIVSEIFYPSTGLTWAMLLLYFFFLSLLMSLPGLMMSIYALREARSHRAENAGDDFKAMVSDLKEINRKLSVNSGGAFSIRESVNSLSNSPWRFYITSASLLGLLFAFLPLADWVSEGFFPATLSIAILGSGIFFAAEFASFMLGILVMGGFLGLRPSIPWR